MVAITDRQTEGSDSTFLYYYDYLKIKVKFKFRDDSHLREDSGFNANSRYFKSD